MFTVYVQNTTWKMVKLWYNLHIYSKGLASTSLRNSVLHCLACLRYGPWPPILYSAPIGGYYVATEIG